MLIRRKTTVKSMINVKNFKVRVTINWKTKKVKVKVRTSEDLWKSKPAEGNEEQCFNVTIDKNQNRKWQWQKNFKSKNLKKVKWEEWPKRKPEGNEERGELCRTGLSTFSAEATRKSYWYIIYITIPVILWCIIIS